MINNQLLETIRAEIGLTLAGIDKIAIGTGAAPAADGAVLPSEVLRKDISESFIIDNTFIYEVFFDETEGNGTIFTNTGLFDDTLMLASDSLNNVSKTNKQSLTISYEITISIEEAE